MSNEEAISQVKLAMDAIGLKIPVMPTPLLKICTELKGDGDIQNIADIIADDVALASMVLKYANSAAFGGKVAITSAAQATKRLGTKHIATLVNMMMWAEIALKIPRKMPALVQYLWRYNAQTSRLIRALLSQYPHLVDNYVSRHPHCIEEAESAGLFANSGLFIAAFHQSEDINQGIIAAGNVFEEYRFVLPGVDEVSISDHSLVLGCLFARDWGATPEVCDAILWQRRGNVDPHVTSGYVAFLDALLTVARYSINTHYAESPYRSYVLWQSETDLQAATALLGLTDDLPEFLETKLDEVVEINYLDEMLKQEKFADYEEGVYKFTMRDGSVKLECVDKDNSVVDMMRKLNAVAAEPQ